MAIPQYIPVSREGGNYSECIGCYDLALGDEAPQFWGRVVATYSRTNKRWYAVLHTFDGTGEHLGTEHWFAGTTEGGEAEAIERAWARLDEMVAALGEIEWADIEISLFQVEIDGATFGLVDVSQPEEGPAFAEQVAMEPGNLLFRAPWDGSYST